MLTLLLQCVTTIMPQIWHASVVIIKNWRYLFIATTFQGQRNKTQSGNFVLFLHAFNVD
jgi:hypothetical protein